MEEVQRETTIGGLLINTHLSAVSSGLVSLRYQTPPTCWGMHVRVYLWVHEAWGLGMRPVVEYWPFQWGQLEGNWQRQLFFNKHLYHCTASTQPRPYFAWYWLSFQGLFGFMVRVLGTLQKRDGYLSCSWMTPCHPHTAWVTVILYSWDWRHVGKV